MPAIAPIQTLEADTLFVVLPGYSAPGEGEPFRDAGPMLNAIAGWLARRRSPAMRGHVRIHRDYYGNPRTPAYMINAAGELIARSSVKRVVALTGPNAAITQAEMPWVDDIRVAPVALAKASVAALGIGVQPADAVLLLHADALGIGLSALERQLLAVCPDRVAVLNGRRRCYRLTPQLRGILGRHRFHAETRIVDSVLARLTWLGGGAFAVIDAMLRRDRA